MAFTNLEKEIGVRIGTILDRDFPNVQKKDLALKLGIPNSNFSDMLSGKRRFHVDMIYTLAEALNVSSDYLIGRSDVPSASADMQAAVKVLGLSQKAVENIASRNEALIALNEELGTGQRSSMDLFFESDYSGVFFDAWDIVGEQAKALYDSVSEYRYRMSNEELSAMLQLSVFRLMKAAEAAALGIFNPDEIIAEAEAADDKESDDGQETS